MPDDRAETKRDADKAAHFFDRLIARGLSRREACDLTVAYLLAGMARASDAEADDAEDWKRE